MAADRRFVRTAGAGFACLAAVVVGVAVAGDLRAHPGIAAALFLGALFGAGLIVRAAATAATAAAQAAQLAAARALLLSFIGLRVLALGAGPTLSDDVHRYVHEGRAQRLGLAVPYATPPASITPPPDDGTTALVNHPEVPAAYPPGVELVLLVTVAVGDAVRQPLLPLRLLLVAADVAVLLLLFRRDRRRLFSGSAGLDAADRDGDDGSGRQRRRRGAPAFVVYGAHPLPLLEIAIGAHLDGLGVAAIVAALALSRPAAQGALIGLGAHVKPLAVLALVGLSRRALPLALAGFVVAVTLPALPYLVAGAPLGRGFFEYATRWQASPFVFALIEAPLVPLVDERPTYLHAHATRRGLLIEDGGRALVSLGDAATVARPILLDAKLFARLIAGALLACAIVLAARSRASPEARVAAALSAVLLLGPTVHPWYLVWLVPFAALTHSRGLLAFTASAPLLYQPIFAYARGDGWNEAAWPRLLIVALLAGGLALDVLRARRRGADVVR